MTEPLRVGVLFPGDIVPAWEKRAIERMDERTDVEVTHVVINDRSGPENLTEYLASSFPAGASEYLSCCLDRFRSYPLWSLTGIFRQLSGVPPHREPRHVDSIDCLASATRIRCRPVPAPGFGNCLPDDVAVEVGTNTDLVIRLGFGVLKGEFLTMPTHGVLSFHRGNLEAYRGQPGGFWEFLRDESTAGVTLQRITETLDGGEIIAQRDVDIADAHTWREVERRQIAACEDLLVAGVQSLSDPAFEPKPPRSLGDLYSIPTGPDVLRYVGKTVVGNLRALRSRTRAGSRGSEDRTPDTA